MFAAVAVLCFSFAALAQSVIITPKKVTYKRPKPIADYKKSFTVNYPQIKAATPALSKKIETAISYEKVNGFNLKDEMSEFQWLEEADYEVLYNKSGLLNISLYMTGSAAYPSTNTKTVLVNLKTGMLVKPIDVFTNLKGLAAKLKVLQKAEIEAAKKEIKASPEATEVNPDELFQNADFTAINIDEFTFRDQGLVFKYDYGFPHVIQALQPLGEYPMTWTELKSFIKNGSVFERFAR